MQNIVTPRIMPGFMELLPKQQLVFNKIKDTIEEVFSLYGFLPIDTPVLELSEILLAKGGGETEKQIYRFNKGETDMSLRFDLTVPLARYVAMHKNELNFPFKKWQIGKSYRGERAQKGRFREFYQCDADIIGDGELSILSDAEIISIISEVYTRLKISNFKICISNRKILSGLMDTLQIANKIEVQRILDKYKKIGLNATREMLGNVEQNPESIDKLLNIFGNTESSENVLNILKNLSDTNKELEEGIQEIETIFNSLNSMGVPKDSYAFDLTVIRGLDYYTGTVFETIVTDHLDFGSIGGGGRYDDLASNYTKCKLPGVGVSFGITRLFDMLMENDMLSSIESDRIDVAIIPIGETNAECFKLASILRNQNIKVDFYYFNKNLKYKLNLANKSLIPFVVIVGEDEVKSNIYVLKDMDNSVEYKFKSDDIATFINNRKIIRNKTK